LDGGSGQEQVQQEEHLFRKCIISQPAWGVRGNVSGGGAIKLVTSSLTTTE